MCITYAILTAADKIEVNDRIYLLHFLYFCKLNYIFLSFKNDRIQITYSEIKITIKLF